MSLSWKPKLNGNIYCAPACGGGCTRAAYEKAIADAQALVARLKGKGWRPVVHENLGWHFKVVSGPVQVYRLRDGRFWAMIGGQPKDCAGGLAMWTPQRNRHFKDPNRAVRYALSFAENVVSELNETLVAARKAAGK